jgi:peptide/nickel transport system substrate-binding protein
MKRISLLLVAAINFCPASMAATRPHYGGTLRMEMRGTLSGFDVPVETKADNALLRNTVQNAVCNRLVELDSNAAPRPSLALSWRSERDGRSWHFTLREGVLMQNGTPLTPQMVITGLAAANPDWHVRAEGREVLIQSDTPILDVLHRLAESRNSICLAGDNSQWIGSGPFQISDYLPGQHIELRSFDDAWQGRPFLDRIRIEMGRTLADQAIELPLGKTDVIEADPTQQRAFNSTTQPIQLFALVFTKNRPASFDPKIREAIARSIDRSSIFSVLLRRQGEQTAALLPEWVSGYAHLFSTAQDLAGAQQVRASPTSSIQLSLVYDGNDPLAKLIAERVAVNAREAGIVIQTRPESPAFRSFDADAKLARVRIAPPDRAVALIELADNFDIPMLRKAESAGSIYALYSLESDALKDRSVIPLAYIPEAFTLSPAVRDWKVSAWGEFDLGNLWIEVPR